MIEEDIKAARTIGMQFAISHGLWSETEDYASEACLQLVKIGSLQPGFIIRGLITYLRLQTHRGHMRYVQTSERFLINQQKQYALNEPSKLQRRKIRAKRIAAKLTGPLTDEH